MNVWLPNRDKAYISSDKITKYLLSETHPVGKSKARFFRLLGFNEATAKQLKQELLAIAYAQPVQERTVTPHGVKYVIDGFLQAPQGARVRVRTVWIIEEKRKRPRFVTAYPID